MSGTPDAVIVGGGLIGLACAAAIGERGGSATILDDQLPGTASPAAAGMLAPSVERGDGPASAFGEAARDRYPSYLAWLAEVTGIDVPLNRRGILQVAITERGARGLRRAMPATATWLDAATVRAAEPKLAHAMGAVHHALDGAVDNGVLLAALELAVQRSARIARHAAAAAEVVRDATGIGVRTSDGALYRAGRVIIAAGAWAGAIRGLPRPLPITPLRGQMLAYAPVAIEHVLFGPRGYVVPRVAHAAAPAETLVGATSEKVGVDSATTASGERALHAAGSDIAPVLGRAVPTRHWAGLRPMTPDLLPIIGPDPDVPQVLYACGHSRNGILLAPLTGDCIAGLALGEAVRYDLSPFRVDRFER